MSGATARVVWEKIHNTYQMKNVQSKLNFRTKLPTIKFQKDNYIQDHMKSLEEIFIALSRLNNRIDDKDQSGIRLRSLPEYFGFLAIIDDSLNVD